MTERLANSVAQSLMAIGLYTVAFESLVLATKEQMQGFLTKQEPSALRAFYGSLNTANSTLKFCEPRLIAQQVLDESDLKELVTIRRRRNAMAHEGYNEMFALTVSNVEPDIRRMLALTIKIQNWGQAIRADNRDGSSAFYIAPSIFGLYLQVASELAEAKLQVLPD